MSDLNNFPTEALKINCTLTRLTPSYVAPLSIMRNKELKPVAHASQRPGMLVLRRTQIEWRIVKHIIAPHLMNNAGWRDLLRLKAQSLSTTAPACARCAQLRGQLHSDTNCVQRALLATAVCGL